MASSLPADLRRSDDALSGQAQLGDWRITDLVRRVHDQQYWGTLKEMSPSLGLSEQYLGKLFKRHKGLTFHVFLRQHRIYNAARMLLGDRNLKDIANLTGYKDLSNFNHDFQSVYGLSPKRFSSLARTNPTLIIVPEDSLYSTNNR